VIGKNKKTEAQYEELLLKYDSLYAKYSELGFQMKEMKANSDSIREQDEEIRKLHESIRSIKHDMKNHLMVTVSYLNENDPESAKQYISQILNKLNAVHSYIETGNSLLNHILNEKLSLAREKGIDIKAEVENLEFRNMESVDFSALLTNLLDNAIEASALEIASGFNPELRVSISKRREYETIVVKNKVSASVLENNPELETSKEDKEDHGKGVAQIRQITERYNGMCDFYEEDGFFVACAFIPI
jgi:sensor histidine kinase regulating citrate/malate metabolism